MITHIHDCDAYSSYISYFCIQKWMSHQLNSYQRTKTYHHHVKHEAYEQVLNQMTAELQKGRQAYVICPPLRVRHLEDVQNVVALFESRNNIMVNNV